LKFLKLTKRHNEHERCLALWTPWLTVIWDFGSVQCRGTDEFELVIKYKAWGPIFYWGNRDIEKLGERSKFDMLQFTKIQPRYAENRQRRIAERDFFEHKEQQVRQGKKKNPADMTYAERHEATMEAVKRMKFSENFMHLMTTPVAKLALERGEVVEDIDFDGTHTGKFLTAEWFEDDKKKYVPVGLPSGGILGFKKAESGEGYEAISIPGAELRKVASGVNNSLHLEDGR
jgi:hypothetical protein